jgi:hypothetical protein
MYLKGYDYALYCLYNLNHVEYGLLAWGDAIFISPIVKEKLQRSVLISKP